MTETGHVWQLTCLIILFIIIKSSSSGPRGKNKIVYKLISLPHKHLHHGKQENTTRGKQLSNNWLLPVNPSNVLVSNTVLSRSFHTRVESTRVIPRTSRIHTSHSIHEWNTHKSFHTRVESSRVIPHTSGIHTSNSTHEWDPLESFHTRVESTRVIPHTSEIHTSNSTHEPACRKHLGN